MQLRFPNQRRIGGHAFRLGGVTSAIASAAMFGNPTTQTIEPVGIAPNKAVGTPTVAPGAVTIEPVGIPSNRGVGTPTLVPGAATIEPVGIAPNRAVGTPLIVVEGGTQFIVAVGIPPNRVVGEPTLTPGAVTVEPVGIPPNRAVGEPTLVVGEVPVIAPVGIPRRGGVGAPTVVRGNFISPVGIPSRVEVGEPTITLAAQLEIELAQPSELGVDLRTPRAAQIGEEFNKGWQGGVPVTQGTVPGSGMVGPPSYMGVSIPTQSVFVREGRFNRRRAFWNDGSYPVGAAIGGSPDPNPWQAFWEPSTPYSEVPNVLQVDMKKDYSSKGVGSATIEIENIMYPANVGGGHDVRRGYLSPLRGYMNPELAEAGGAVPTDLDGTPVTQNEWYGKLRKMAQITVYQTYGEVEPPKVFTGLIDDVDMVSRPDRITLTVRDFGQVLTDERVFGWNKDPNIRDAVTFIDRRDAYNLTRVAYDASASSSAEGHEAELAIDGDSTTFWQAGNSIGPAFTQWLQFRVRDGVYNNYFLNPDYDGATNAPDLEVYIAILPKNKEDGTPSTRDGVNLTENVWVDTGLGDVPGAAGGVPYVLHLTDVSLTGMRRTLDAEYELGEDSIIRIHVRGLPQVEGTVFYAAGVSTAVGYSQSLKVEAVKQRWVIVDDISDVVKVILRWAGFKEWEVENTGTPLPKRLVYQRGSVYMDVIDKVAEAIGYIFFMGDPTSWENSIGVPVFRKSRVVATGASPKLVVTDRVMLNEIAVKESDEPLSYIIRVRGRSDPAGSTLGGESGRRLMYTFRPPWIGTAPLYADGRLAGVLKHVIRINNLYKTIDDCRFGAYAIALQQALASILGTVEFPGYPGVDLDDHILLEDLGTGLTTRLAIAERSSSFRMGEQSKWSTTVSGSLIDTPDIQSMVQVINEAVPNVGNEPVITIPDPADPPPPGDPGAGGDPPSGALLFEDTFEGTEIDATKWDRYNGPGHAGNGLRDPASWSVVNGQAVCTAWWDGASIHSGGMSAKGGGRGITYGIFEVRMRAEADPSGQLAALALTWPDSENWPHDGELDWYETSRGIRFPYNSFLHHMFATSGSDQTYIGHNADASDWHTQRMVWEPTKIEVFRDGVLIGGLYDASKIPNVPHHVCLQQDALSNGPLAGPVRTYYDYIRVWAL